MSHPSISLRSAIKRCAPAVSLVVSMLLAFAVVLQPAVTALAANADTYESLGTLRGSKTGFAFVVASDSHNGYGPADDNTTRAFEDMKTRYTGLSFMIHMGDVTETGAASEYAIFQSKACTLPFPVMATMGNHEARWQDPQGSLFRDEFGAPNYSFNYGSWHFVVLDTTFPGETLGTLDPATVAWLEKDLAASGSRPVAIFSHHPLLYAPASFQDSDDAFARILDKYPVAAVFCGHGHSFISWKAQGRQFQMVGALMDAAYSVVQIQGTSMIVNAISPGPDGKMQESVVASLNGAPRPDREAASSNPVTAFEASLKDNTLTGKFTLSRDAQVGFQIDDGYYNLLGAYGAGEHQFTADVSGQANGTHAVRLKAVASDIPYYTPAEFDKGTSGLLAWKTDLGSDVVGDILAYNSNKAVVGTRDGKIRCVNLTDGKTVWQYDAGSTWGGGVIDGGTLYFDTANGTLGALRMTTGKPAWRAAVDTAGFLAPPVVASTKLGKTVIAGSTSGKVYAVKATNGHKAWQYQASGAIASAAVVSGGKVYFGAWGGSAYALDASTGKLAWSTPLGRQVYYAPYLTPAVSDGKVLVTLPYDTKVGGSLLIALDAKTGKTVWQVPAGSSLMAPSVVAGDQISVMDAAGAVSLYSLDDGTFLKKTAGAGTLFTAVPGKGPVYLTGGYRGVLSFITPDGRADYAVRDSSLFISPLLAPSTAKKGWTLHGSMSGAKYLTLVADTRGRLTALAFPR